MVADRLIARRRSTFDEELGILVPLSLSDDLLRPDRPDGIQMTMHVRRDIEMDRVVII